MTMQNCEFDGFVSAFEAYMLGNLPKLPSATLQNAMHYALSSPGKRIRPLLLHLSAQACAENLAPERLRSLAWPSAVAIEYVHTYSLVHDDLPAMDDDDYRRGCLSTHKRFDDASAILVGDALLSDAFALLASAKYNAHKQVGILAKAIGSQGMVAGQMLDVAAEKGINQKPDWLYIHQLKTAALMKATALLGGLSVDANHEQLKALKEYADAFGLVFQLTDDLLDDASLVREKGRGYVQECAQQEVQKALRALSVFGDSAGGLKALLDLVLKRQE